MLAVRNGRSFRPLRTPSAATVGCPKPVGARLSGAIYPLPPAVDPVEGADVVDRSGWESTWLLIRSTRINVITGVA